MSKKVICAFGCGILAALLGGLFVFALFFYDGKSNTSGQLSNTEISRIKVNDINLSLNGDPQFSKGEVWTTDLGESVPSSMLYTDGTGAEVVYLPVDYIAPLLDIPTLWNSATRTKTLGTVENAGELSVTLVTGDSTATLPLERAGSIVEPFAEVAPIPIDDKVVRRKITYCSSEDYVTQISAKPQWGRYISISVTNHGDFPLILHIGRKYTVGRDMLSSRIPARETVTRTFDIQNAETLRLRPELTTEITYPGGVAQTMDITVSVAQFN